MVNALSRFLSLLNRTKLISVSRLERCLILNRQGNKMLLENSLARGKALGDGFFNLASVVIPTAGDYHFTAAAGVLATKVAGFFVIGFTKNNIVISGDAGYQLRADTDTQFTTALDVNCAVGDVVAVFVTQVSRENLIANDSRISAFKL